MGADAFGAVIAPRCPVTGGLPTRMTETAFRRACTVKRGTDARDWRYRRCKQQPLPPIRCRQCNGRRGNWPAELAITNTQGEPMTTKTKTTTKTKPAPAPIEDMPNSISAEARVSVLLKERWRAMEILAAFFGVPSDPGLEAMAENAVRCARELERTIKDGGKAGPSCAAVGRILTETIVSGRGEIQITIRPYAAPASTPTEADA